MSQSNAFNSRLRDSTGLAITIAVHAGVAAVALLAVTVTAPDQPRPPIITTAVPDTPKPLPTPIEPVLRDLPVRIDVPVPELVFDTPPLPDDRLVLPQEPPILGPGDGTVIEQTLPLPVGPTRIARLDPRHAATAQPPYPVTARRLGEEGAVIVHVRIGRDGRVLAATLAQSSGSPRLDAAALDHAMKRWRFTPALDNGAAIESARDITVQFRLADASG